MENIKYAVVDDETKNQKIIINLVSKFFPNLKLIGARNNIRDAEELIEKEKPNLVFLDIEMPGGNGTDLISKFDTIPFHIVFATAHTWYTDKFIKKVGLDFILKPFNINRFKTIVQKNLDRIQSDTTETKSNYNEKIKALKFNLTQSDFNSSLICLSQNNHVSSYPLNKIILFYQKEEKVFCKTTSQKNAFEISESIKNLMQILQDTTLKKVNDTTVINTEFISQIKDTENNHFEVVLKDHTDTVVISEKVKNQLIKTKEKV